MKELIKIGTRDLGRVYGDLSRFYAAMEKFQACFHGDNQEDAGALFSEAFALAPETLKNTTCDEGGQPAQSLDDGIEAFGYVVELDGGE
jgi:hypothetical protein